jgi:hypothetical protein
MALSTCPDAILKSLRSGAKLVTGEKECRRVGRRPYKRLLCELDGESVNPTTVKALIACRELVEVEGERTKATRTWRASR